MTENHTVLDNVLGWLHEGYPEGIPQKDYFPLLALPFITPAYFLHLLIQILLWGFITA